MNHISEALRLFQLERQFNILGEKPVDLDDIKDLTAVKVHELVPEIPSEWSSSSLPMQSSDLITDFVVNELINRTLSNLTRVVKEDLGWWLQQIPHPKMLKTTENVYKLLQEMFPNFQPISPTHFNPVDQEIYTCRIDVLKLSPVKELIEMREQRSYEELAYSVNAHYKLLLQLMMFQVADRELEFNFPVSAVIQLKKSFSEKNVEPIFVTPPTPFIYPKINKPLLINLRASDKELADIQRKSEENGVLMTPHQAQKQYGVNKTIEVVMQVTANYLMYGPFSAAVTAGTALKELVSSRVLKNKVLLDIDSRRHKELMKAMKKLQKTVVGSYDILGKQLEAVENNLVILAKNQISQEKNLKITMKFLELQREEFLGKFSSLSQDHVISHLALGSILDVSSLKARAVRTRMHREQGFNLYFNRFIRYESLLAFYKRERQALGKALQELPSLFLYPGKNDGAFVIPSTKNTQHARYIQHYQSIFHEHLEKLRPMTQRRKLEYLIHPISRCKEAEEAIDHFSKEVTLATLPEWMQDALGTSGLRSLLKIPYEFEKVIDSSLSAHAFHYFYELFRKDPGGPLYSLENIDQCTPTSQGIQLLRNAFIRVSLAIAQANILVGTHILPRLCQDVLEGKKETRILVGTNFLLAKNVMLYMIRKEYEKQKRPLTDYYFAYHFPHDSTPLKELLGKDWAFEWNGEQWSMKFDSSHTKGIPLPTPREVLEGNLIPHPQLSLLLHTRNLLLRELAGYQPTEGVQTPAQKRLYLGVLLTSLYFRKINQDPGVFYDGKNKWTSKL